MSDRRKQIRVGIFAIVVGSLAALVLVVFGGVHLFAKRAHYTVEYPDSVIGLEKGAMVYMNGIKVGNVDKIEVAPGDISHVLITLDVKEGTPVHADTQAYLSLAGITGLKVIDLKGGTLASPVTAEGGRIAAGEGTLDKLQKKADQLITATDHIITRTGQIMDQTDAVVDHANRVMTNLESVTDPKALGAIVASTQQSAANLAATTGQMRAMVAENRASLKTSLDAIAQTTTSARDLMDHQVATLFGSANDLLVDLRGLVHTNESSLQAVLADFRQTSRNMKDFSREVREKPSRLLFSKAAPERKLP